MREADLLASAALLDASGATARLVTERIDTLVASFDGGLWPIKADHVRAVAASTPLDAVLAAYRELGYDGMADGVVSA